MARLAASARTSSTTRQLVQDQSSTLIFDGVSGRVDFGTAFSFERTQSLSIAFWIRVNNFTNSQEIIGKRLNSGTFRGWAINLTTSGQIQVILRTSATNSLQAVSGSRVLVPNLWQHVVITYDGSSLVAGVKLYIGAVEKTLSSADNDLNATIITTGIASIGARNGGTDLFFAGALTQVRLFTSILTVDEVSSGFYLNSWPTAYACYLMTDLGASLTDTGTSGSTGTLEGTTSWGIDGPIKLRSAASGRSAA